MTMFSNRISKLAKIGLMTSVTFVGLTGVTFTMAGGMVPPHIDYPAPLPPEVPKHHSNDSHSSFKVSVEASTTYKIYESNDGVSTTTTDQILAELRPYLAYSVMQNGVEFGGAVMTAFVYEVNSTPAFRMGRTEGDLIVEKAGDFAVGLEGGYVVDTFVSTSPAPAGLGEYATIDARVFADKFIGDFGLSLSASYIREDYFDTPQTGGAADVDETAANNTFMGGDLRLIYYVNKDISLFSKVSYGRVTYDVAGVPSKNETRYGIRTGGSYNFSEQMALEIAGSYERNIFDGVGGNVEQIFGADATYTASIGDTLNGSVYVEGIYKKNSIAITDTKQIIAGWDLDYKITDTISNISKVEVDLIMEGPTPGIAITSSSEINYAVLDNLDIFLAGSYKYAKDNSPGWTKDYGITLGLNLHY